MSIFPRLKIRQSSDNDVIILPDQPWQHQFLYIKHTQSLLAQYMPFTNRNKPHVGSIDFCTLSILNPSQLSACRL